MFAPSYFVGGTEWRSTYNNVSPVYYFERASGGFEKRIGTVSVSYG